MSDYANPLVTRYASHDMSEIFSEEEKIVLWRRLWVALAESEKELGLGITDRQIEELKQNVTNLNLDVAHEREKVVRHDVMAQIYAYALQCPLAAPIIHLGATSCFVDDNADLISYYKALVLLRNKIVAVIAKLKDFANKYKNLPTLAFTHLQPAQPTTVGKRATLWAQDLAKDYENVTAILDNFRIRGVKGTTGTQASFKELFSGDYKKVKELDKLVCNKMGFEKNVCRQRSDLYEKIRFRTFVRACRHCRKRNEIRKRYKAFAKYERNRGAFRGNPDWQFRNGI